MAKVNNPGKLFKTLLKTTSKDATRPILGCAYLAENGDAVSTDTYRLTVVHDAWSGGANISIPNEVVRGLAKAKAAIKTAELTVSDDGGFIKATLSDGTEFGDELPNGKFPNYLQLFEGLKDNTTAYVKTKEALAVIREHVKCKREVRVDVYKDNIRIYGYGEERLPEWGCEKAAEGMDNIATFNGAWLRDALMACGNTAELHIDSGIRPMIVKDAERNIEVLVMPINRPTNTAKNATPKAERKPERKPVNPAVKHDLETALYKIAIDRAANDPDSRVYGGNANCGHRNLVFEYERSGQLTHDELGDLTSWYVDGEFVVCIERRWSKRKIHLTHPELKPFKHKADLVASRKVERAAKEKAGADVKATVSDMGDGVTAVVIEPKKEDNDMELKKRIEELEAELAKRNAELEEVWKENETLKRAPKPEPKAEEPKPEPKADMPTAVTLETMQAWCEGKGLLATQKRAGTCIWVEGDSKPYADELKELGFRFAKKRKSWYFATA